MTINLTPAIQNQIYMDKKDGYLINMVDKLTPEIDYKPEEKTTQKDEDEKKSYEKRESFFKESEFGFTSYMTKKSLNNSFSTQGFFDTLGYGGNVKKAS